MSRSTRSAQLPLALADCRVLELLAAHRVLTADLLAQASGLPSRGIRARLQRLLDAGLVTRRRGSASAGSAPFHWWLTTAGRTAVGARGRVRSQDVSPLFIEHTVAIAAFAITLDRRGPEAGISLLGWQRDRDGWETWQNSYGRHSITPDGRADVALVMPGDPEPERLVLMVEISTATGSCRVWVGQLHSCVL